jgi:branched-chain amino acid transport system permease protein
MLIQFLLNGLITGLLYSLASLGFALVYHTTKIFHIAMAVIYVIAAYIFWQVAVNFGWPVWISILTSMVAASLISLGIEKWVYLPLHHTKSSLNVILVSSIGVFTVLTNVVAMIWGNETKTLSNEISRIYQTGDLILTEKQLLQLLISLLAILLFFILLNRSRTGLRVKAVRDDPELYEVMGYSTAAIRSVAFILSGAIVALGACLTSWDIGMDPYVGMPVLLNAIVALIIGGLGRFESCVIGGVTLGILQALVVWQWSAQWQEAITFVFLIIFLFFRPQGFIGEKTRLV